MKQRHPAGTAATVRGTVLTGGLAALLAPVLGHAHVGERAFLQLLPTGRYLAGGAAVVAVVPVVATGGLEVPAVVAGVGGGVIAGAAGGTDEVAVDAATDVVGALVVDVDVVEGDSTRTVVVGALDGATAVVLTTAAPATS